MPTGLRGQKPNYDDGDDDGWGPADESDLMMAGPADAGGDSLLIDDQRQASKRAGPSQTRFAGGDDGDDAVLTREDKPKSGGGGGGGKRGNRFSLFVAPKPAEDDQDDYEEEQPRKATRTQEADDVEATYDDERQPQADASRQHQPHSREPRVDDKDRDEHLRASLFELRKMNDVFDGFMEALESAKGHNEVRSAVSWVRPDSDPDAARFACPARSASHNALNTHRPCSTSISPCWARLSIRSDWYSMNDGKEPVQ